MRKLLYIVIVALGCLLTGLLPTSAQSYGWQEAWRMTCPSPNGDYTHGGVFPRYEPRNKRLVLIDVLTETVMRELETSLTTPQFWLMGWSPDCHYLVGGIGTRNHFTAVI